MTREQVRIGIVGAGDHIRTVNIPNFRSIDDVEIVSVANRSRESTRRVAEDLDIPKVYGSWVELIAAPDTNAIVIGTWPYMHHPLVLAALDHGKHVLTQGRMAMNAREAREMLQASRNAPHLVCQVAPVPFYGLERTIGLLMADGYLGDILSVEMAVHTGFVNREAPFIFRHDRDLSGYNVMMVGMAYEIVSQWVGPASSVAAITRVHVPTRTDGSGGSHFVTVPDHAEILCELASGAVMHMRVSDVCGLSPLARAWIFGSEGTLRIDIDGSFRATLSGGRRGDLGLSEIEIAADQVPGVEEEFVNAIRGLGSVTHTTFEDGVRNMEFTEAVARSAQERRTIYLPL